MSEAHTGNPALNIGISIGLLIASALFVGGEYALVSMRRARLESLAKKGSPSAKRLLKISENLSPFIAGTQVGITMVGIAMGSITEPYVSGLLEQQFSMLNKTLVSVVSFVLVLFCLVVVGELVPKYLALKHPERFAAVTHRALQLFVRVFKPVIWLAQTASQFILKPLGIDIKETGKESVAREELLMIVQATGSDGVLEKEHANMVTRALRLDMLAARDVMVHRLDIQWLDIDLAGSDLLNRINKIRHTRIPVCRGDVDDIVGIVYLVDVLRLVQTNEFKLDKIVRPFIAIPENLPIERIITTMRDEKTQILIVMDEYGGTSGLISLEDVVEEVFGEMEDGPESERQPVEVHASGRVSAKAELRLDELISKLGLDPQLDESTETLANIIVNGLERIPRPGDTYETSLGLMRVENMARRRITRVGIQLKPSLLASGSEG